jgi:hypothetical protein
MQTNDVSHRIDEDSVPTEIPSVIASVAFTDRESGGKRMV